ncbi:MAG: tetratricopeptide repeat protein [Acidobacteriaceae bacterium]|nr:tetratricopeptide repeat protein [Acidobacteriaceae bacterium]
MRWVNAILPFFFILAAHGETAIAAGQTVLVVPFENRSKAPGLEWIGDSFPELLKQRLDSPTIYVLPREERIRAYDRLSIPVELRASRPTIYRIAEQIDVDYVVLGQYEFDGRTFTTNAQLLDMRRERLLPEAKQAGTLPDLITVENTLAWEILHTLFPADSISREAYLAQVPVIRLDAFENYVKGVIAPTADERIQHLREALRLSPSYSAATLRLGEAYYQQRQYDQAMVWLSKIPPDDPDTLEAQFYLGLAAYNRSDFSRAESAFSFVSERLPLGEMYNNLAVALDHRDRAAAIENLQKAIAQESSNPDYHFNLAVELYRRGDVIGASRQLREALSLSPHDSEAKSFLENIGGAGQRGVVTASIKVPQTRMRTTYDESSFRQLALKISAVAEQRLSKSDARTHAQFHSERGHQLLKQGFLVEAEREFREAVTLNPSNAEAHAGLASVLEASNHFDQARSEAQEAVRLHPSAEALLVLAESNLRDNRTGAAAEEIDRALRLEPSNAAAQVLKRSVAAKLAQEGQPLPEQ